MFECMLTLLLLCIFSLALFGLVCVFLEFCLFVLGFFCCWGFFFGGGGWRGYFGGFLFCFVLLLFLFFLGGGVVLGFSGLGCSLFWGFCCCFCGVCFFYSQYNSTYFFQFHKWHSKVVTECSTWQLYYHTKFHSVKWKGVRENDGNRFCFVLTL